MKIIKSVLLLLIMFVLCFSCSAYAASACFELSTTADVIKKDESVFLLLNLKENKGFGAMQFCISYDSEKLFLESVSPGELIPDGAISSLNTGIDGEIHFSVISLEDIKGDGTILVSDFRAKQPGKADFDFKLSAFSDSLGVTLDSMQRDAEIMIESEEERIPEENGAGGYYAPSATEKEEKKEEIKEAQKEDKQIIFNDVGKNHWAYSQIMRTAEMGLFGGTGENIFSPDLPMTRAMFVTVLHRYAGSPEAEKADFTDVDDSWYSNAVSWAAQNGIVSGTGENKFSPDAYITRGQIATILCRYKNGKSLDVNSINSFNDLNAIPDWGKEPIAWAIEQGLIMGRTGGNIAFNDNATRAETAVIFTRFLNIR